MVTQSGVVKQGLPSRANSTLFHRSRQYLPKIGWTLLSIGLFTLLWEFAWLVGWADPKLLPPPHVFMGDLPAHSVDRGHGSIAGILWKLNLLSPSLAAQWMNAALVNAPERSRNDFLGAFDSGLPLEDFTLAVRAFMSACQRHRKFQNVQGQ